MPFSAGGEVDRGQAERGRRIAVPRLCDGITDRLNKPLPHGRLFFTHQSGLSVVGLSIPWIETMFYQERVQFIAHRPDRLV
jgi:hypothetical protein